VKSATTRRAFVGMVAAAAAVLAAKGPWLGMKGIDDGIDDSDRPRSPWTGTTRWIGHC
jgi:hypothetical protein